MTHVPTDDSPVGPSDEEIAAAIVVLLASRAAGAGDEGPPSLWRDHTAILRAPLMPGPGSWRASALPR